MYINADYYNLVAAGGAFTVSGTLDNYTITDDDIILDSFQIDEALNSNGGLQIGGVVTSQLKLTLNNYEGNFDPDDLTEESTLALTLTIGTESCPLPAYHIIDKTVTDNTIILTLLDFTDTLNAKLDSASPLTGATYLALVTDICTRFGLTVTCDTAAQSRLSASATGASFSYDNATYKSALQHITEKCNCYARISSGKTLRFFFPDPTAQTIPITSDMIASLDIEGPHYPTFVAVKGWAQALYTAAGTFGYNLKLYGNPLITTPTPGTYLTAFTPLIFYNFELDAIGDPSVQIGDYITIGGSEQCLVARKTFKLGGYMTLGFKWNIDSTLDFDYATDDEQNEVIIQEIESAVSDFDDSLTQTEVFNRLTNNSQNEGIYLQNGHIYINGTMVKADSISASALDVDDINASGELTIGALSDGTQDNILNSKVQVGGRNLVLDSAWSDFVPDTGSVWTNNGDGTVTASSAAVGNTDNALVRVMRSVSDYGKQVIGQGTEVTLTAEYKITENLVYGSTSPWVGIQIGFTHSGTNQYVNWFGQKSMPTAVCDWTKLSVTATINYDLTTITPLNLWFRDVKGSISLRNIKLEVGNKATDWTPAPEDVDASIDGVANDIPTVNMLPSVYRQEYQYGETWTSNGVDWVLNADGSVTASLASDATEATANSNYYLTGTNMRTTIPTSIELDPTKKYTVSGCPVGGGSSSYRIHIRWFYASQSPAGSGGNVAFDTGEGYTNKSAYKYVNVLCQIVAGYTFPDGPITFYPQLELGETVSPYSSTHNGSNAASDLTKQAAKTATSFITYINSTDGIKVHNSDDTTDYIQMNSNAVSIFRDGTEVSRFEDSKIILGNEEETHAEMTAAGYDIIYGTTKHGGQQTPIAHLGYVDSTQLGNSPYTTLGIRASGTYEGAYSVAEGNEVEASANYSHAEGRLTKATASGAHAEGISSEATGNRSHAEGYASIASGSNSHAEGNQSTASYESAHSEGQGCSATNLAAHAEGNGSQATGSSAHAEGFQTIASGEDSHAEGYQTVASVQYTHAEGRETTASGTYAHAQGYLSEASGRASHAGGEGTKATGVYQTVIGQYNVAQGGSPRRDTDYALILGNGTADNARSTAFAVTWGGSIFHQGDKPLAISAYGTCDTAADTATKVVTVAGGFTLTAGSIIGIKFDNTNTAASPKFNVNGTGAKSIKYQATAPYTSGNWVAGQAGYVNYYMYDGTYWVFMCQSQDRNTTYTPASLGFGYGTCTTAAATAAKAVTIENYTLVVGGIVSVHFTNAVPANATLNIRTRGAKPIFHHNAAITAGVIGAGQTATFMYDGTNYNLIGLI
jgi:hypothetical protein